jgi:hypothetical protein
MPNNNRPRAGGVAPILSLLCLVVLHSGTAWAASVGQMDDFEDGSRQGWQMGFIDATNNNMTNVADGGPAGAGDNFLQVFSDGTAVASGRLTFFNKNQWTGDYLGAGVTSITMHMRNLSPRAPLNMRLGVNGDGGLFVTAASLALAGGSGWTTAAFSILPDDLTSVSGRAGPAGFDAMATLGNVTELRLLNSASPDWTGLPVSATLGIDNIRVVPLPPAAWLFVSALLGLGAVQRRRWHVCG